MKQLTFATENIHNNYPTQQRFIRVKKHAETAVTPTMISMWSVCIQIDDFEMLVYYSIMNLLVDSLSLLRKANLHYFLLVLLHNYCYYYCSCILLRIQRVIFHLFLNSGALEIVSRVRFSNLN